MSVLPTVRALLFDISEIDRGEGRAAGHEVASSVERLANGVRSIVIRAVLLHKKCDSTVVTLENGPTSMDVRAKQLVIKLPPTSVTLQNG